MYPEIWTYASSCDGVVECSGSLDESWLCTNLEIVIYGVLGGIGLLVVASLVYRIIENCKFKKVSNFLSKRFSCFFTHSVKCVYYTLKMIRTSSVNEKGWDYL